MNFAQAYRKTLVKWQRLAAGEWKDPAEDCGLCDWARARARKPPRHKQMCQVCPAYHHYGYGCGNTDCIMEVVDDYDNNERSEFQKSAQLVVEELLSIKDSLFEWAKKLEQS